ncbi:uncharacterized protein LOC128952153 isoform X1 [Oppia nitens]|uniref:uncharacterized protein LOC128952153 isoform X1 n=1 Tax=Oppia nitens TaxID=1686743 RepID=UPI0023DC166C|nr:uncharacterized protein LOC128952153 isoform X1 [Oppia nitens]
MSSPFELCFVALIVTVFTNEVVNGQQDLIRGKPISNVACDRIASQGVLNCMQTYFPGSILSAFNPNGGSGRNSDVCCRYSKYNACIAGLQTGLRLAMERERCSRAYAAKIIRSTGESALGIPLKSYCGTAADGKSRCPPSRTTSKPRKQSSSSNRKPTKRRPTQDQLDPLGLGSASGSGLGSGLDRNNIFNRGTGSHGADNPLTAIGDTINRGIDTIGQGISSILNTGTAALGGATGGVGGGGGRIFESPLSHIGSVFQNGRDTLQRGTSGLLNGGKPNKRTDSSALGGFGSPLDGFLNNGRDTIGNGASGILGGADIFG